MIDRAKADMMRLEQEEARLVARLSEIRAQKQKIANFIEMAGAYGIGGGQLIASVSAASIPPRSSSIPRSSGGAGAVITEAVRQHLREVRRRVSTVDLLDVLGAKGIQVGGDKPRNNLSGILSRAEGLTNDRVRGWGLSEWDQRVPLLTPDSSASEPPVLQSPPDAQD